MSDRSLVPYLAIRGGATIVTPSDCSISDTYNHSPTVNVGSGIKWFLNKDIAIRADYHQNILVNTSDGNNKLQDSMVNYEYSLGLQIIFGVT
jgi:hypothetical protein